MSAIPKAETTPLRKDFSAKEECPPPSIPDHELLRRIGRGSYGEVWLARNVVGTFHAVKIVHRRTFEGDRPFEREFNGIQKFEPISRSHEGLVDILQVGRSEDYFYCVMELADDSKAERGVRSAESTESLPGYIPRSAPRTPHLYDPETLHARLKRHGRLPIDECVQIGLALTSALDCLHGQGLVHRDIKPSNIIFVSGAPKLADIGLVAGMDEARSYVGTEGFIPPEGPGTPQADFYSLGKVLYEISTGKDRHEFPEPLTNLSELPDKSRLLELNGVIHKACHSDPKQRYRSAQEMHGDLALLAQGKSVRQRRGVERRWVIGRKLLLAMSLASLVVAGLFFARNDLARRSAANLSNSDTFEGSGTLNRAAWDAYQKAKLFVNQQTEESLPKAAAQFELATQLDPRFAEAYAGMASTYCFWFVAWTDTPKEAFAKAEEAAHKALALKPNLAEALAALGFTKFGYQYRPAEAEPLLLQAVRLEPNNERALHWLSICLSCEGKAKQAVAAARYAVQLNPASLSLNNNLGNRLLDARRIPEAIQQYQSAAQLAPHSELTWTYLAMAYQLNGQWNDARDAGVKIATLWKRPEVIRAITNAPSASAGVRVFWQIKLADWPDAPTSRETYPVGAAMAAVMAGENEKAIQWLEKATDAPVESGRIKVNPVCDPLRGDPRFAQILRRMGFAP